MSYCQKHGIRWRDDAERCETFPCPQCEREEAAYSANVRLYLDVAGRRIVLGAAGPEGVRLQPSEVATESLPPQSAVVIVEVNGRESHHPVYLPEGVTAGQREIPVNERLDDPMDENESFTAFQRRRESDPQGVIDDLLAQTTRQGAKIFELKQELEQAEKRDAKRVIRIEELLGQLGKVEAIYQAAARTLFDGADG